MPRTARKPRLERLLSLHLILLGGLLAVVMLVIAHIKGELQTRSTEGQQAALEALSNSQAELQQHLQVQRVVRLLNGDAAAFQLEFELVTLDPDRDDRALLQTIRRLQTHQARLAETALESAPLLQQRLLDNLNILLDIADEVLITTSSNMRQQLFRDTIQPIERINSSISAIEHRITAEGLAIDRAIQKVTAATEKNLASQHRLFHLIEWVMWSSAIAAWLLALILQRRFFATLKARLAALEQFAAAIESYPHRARQPFSSKDITGRLATRMALMSRRIRHLVRSSNDSRERAEQLAYYDPLTRLENRRLFFQKLKQVLEEAERYTSHYAILYLDLDSFKQINDSLGHEVGDELLKVVAKRLRQTVRDADSLARLGGDEFAMILSHCDTDTAAGVAERILEALRHPVELATHLIHPRTSIGIAMVGADGGQVGDLMQNVDLALYRAKELGRDNYQFFALEMQQQAQTRLRRLSELRQALEYQAFALYYQPKVDLKSGRIVGLEALLRWPHPDQGFISPAEFIPLAEESGLILPLGRWVIQQACRDIRRLFDQGRAVPVAINLSTRQFEDSQLIGTVQWALESAVVPARLLELEITETMLMEDTDQGIAILEKLKQLGLRVAIDDFGTGFSSMNYLKQLPVDILKIDKSFVDHIVESPQDRAVAETIIDLAHRFHLRVVAEGIETEAQRAQLLALDCDMGQGYLFDRPLPLAKLDLGSIAATPTLVETSRQAQPGR